MKHYLFIIIMLLGGPVIASQIINAQIEPTTAHVGEPLQLTLKLDNAQTGGTPDLTPLQKDFIITGTQASLSYSAINGVAKSTNTWIIQLIAKKSGLITLPPIQVGHLSSTPIQVNITEHADEISTEKESAPQEENATVMLKCEASPATPFINQQVIYTVKLYNRHSLLEADYQPPQVDDALLIPLGEGRRYQTTLKGYQYNVDEQQYAIFPQKSGELHIKPPSLNAVVYDGTAKPIHIKGNPTPIKIAPIPASNTTSHWLPAQQVGLTELYEPSSTDIVQGDTIVRTLRLQAMAMPAELLPTYTFADSKQFSVYPEKPETQNTLRQQTLIGTTVTKVTYLFNQAGKAIIPPLSVTWFNTQTGQEEVITLPAHELTVALKPGSPNTSLTTTPKTAVHKKLITPPPITLPKHSFTLLYWIIGVVSMVGIVIAALRIQSRCFTITRKKRAALKSLKKACAMNDRTNARRALLNWAALQKPGVVLLNLDALTWLDNPELQKQIQVLSRALYSPEETAWNGNALWLAIQHYRPRPLLKKSPYQLPPIHPI